MTHFVLTVSLPEEHFWEMLVVLSTVVLIFVSVLLTYATWRAARIEEKVLEHEMEKIEKKEDRNTRLLLRLLRKQPQPSKHRAG